MVRVYCKGHLLTACKVGVKSNRLLWSYFWGGDAEIPEDAESLENYEKFLAEVHSTINKLSTCTVEPKTNS